MKQQTGFSIVKIGRNRIMKKKRRRGGRRLIMVGIGIIVMISGKGKNVEGWS